MKTMKPRNITLFLLLITASWLTAAMAQTEEQIEKFKQEREAYYNENLELTDAEIKAFWPLYDDFFNRKMKLAEDERNTFMYAHNNADNLSDEEINANLKKIRDLKEQQIQLENQYYQDKFPKVLPPKKVLRLYKVEWDFRRHLLRKLREQGQQGGNRGGGRGAGSELPHPMQLDSDCPF
jgi:hypothetical protein